MKLDKNLEPFRSAIEALQKLFIKYNERGVAIGFLGKPRFTADVDAMFLLSTSEVSQFLEAAQAENMIPRIPDADAFARKNRILLLRHSPSETDIDISLGILPFEEEVVERGSIQSFGNLAIRLPTPEDLIIMKAVAHRPKDLEDIRMIVQSQAHLDTKRIKHWVLSFGEILDMPDLWGQIESLLKSE